MEPASWATLTALSLDGVPISAGGGLAALGKLADFGRDDCEASCRARRRGPPGRQRSRARRSVWRAISCTMVIFSAMVCVAARRRGRQRCPRPRRPWPTGGRCRSVSTGVGGVLLDVGGHLFAERRRPPPAGRRPARPSPERGFSGGVRPSPGAGPGAIGRLDSSARRCRSSPSGMFLRAMPSVSAQ